MRAQIPTSSDEQLSVPQFRILLKLAKESSTHKALAEWMGVAAPTLTRMVDTLVERKLVERVVDSNDRRQIYLSATLLGKSHYDRYRLKVQERLTAKIELLTSAQKSILSEGLRVMNLLYTD